MKYGKSIENVMPAVEVRSKRIGVVPLSRYLQKSDHRRRLSIGMKWVIRFSRARSGKGMAENCQLS
ncbi:MAG: hypothetical protein IPN89_08320 [Saprospiraceae bacterium]|nr:hypothetical protein [Saprospiraceae bacterium]